MVGIVFFFFFFFLQILVTGIKMQPEHITNRMNKKWKYTISSVITIKRDPRWLEDGYVHRRKSLQNHQNPNMQWCACLRLPECFAWCTIASSSRCCTKLHVVTLTHLSAVWMWAMAARDPPPPQQSKPTPCYLSPSRAEVFQWARRDKSKEKLAEVSGYCLPSFCKQQ